MQLNGIPVNFGFTGANGIVVTELTGKLVLQSAEQSKGASLEVALGGQGDHLAHGWHDIHDEATLECIITDPTLTANAVTNTSLAALGPGAFINITACASRPDLVKKWEVQANARITGSNTNFAKVSIPIHYRSTIQAAAS